MRSTILRIGRLLDARARTQLLVMLGAIVVMGFLEMVGVAAIAPFMQLVSEPERLEGDGRLAEIYRRLNFGSPQEAMRWAGGVLLVGFSISMTFSAFTAWLIQRCVWSMAHRICMRLLRNYAALPYTFHLRHSSSDLTKKVLMDVSDVVTGVLLAGATFIAQATLVTFLLILMLIVNPVVALGAFGSLLGAYLLIHLGFRGTLRRLGRDRLDASYGRLTSFTEAMTGVRAIRIEGVSPHFISRFERSSQRFSDLQPTYQILRQAPRYLIELVAYGGLVVVVLVLLSTREALLAAIPTLTLFALAGFKLLPALNRAWHAAAQLSHHLPAVDEVVRDLEAADAAGELEAVDAATAPDVPFNDVVQLDGVHFAYEDGQDVIHGVDVSIRRGERVALIGSTGSGKTTLVDIVIGLLTPQTGAMRVDGVAISPGNAAGWRRRVAYVPQDIFLYDETIARNIAFGLDPDDVDMDRVRAAARVACLDAFVEGELPDGYETPIGERGVRLSGGQRQRIGLARAIYRRPDFLILDEATSALDGTTEAEVMERMGESMPGVTVLMIAHRLSTVRECNRVHLIEDGRIARSGSWEELCAADDRVQRMAQSSD
ncbi:MAG: ABC transporter ATP-binding protein [Phycisphaerales bacterium]